MANSQPRLKLDLGLLESHHVPHGHSSIQQTLAQHSAWPRYTVVPPPQCPCPEHQCPGLSLRGPPGFRVWGRLLCISPGTCPASVPSSFSSSLCQRGSLLHPCPEARVQRGRALGRAPAPHLRPRVPGVKFPGVFISGGYIVGVLTGVGGVRAPQKSARATNQAFDVWCAVFSGDLAPDGGASGCWTAWPPPPCVLLPPGLSAPLTQCGSSRGLRGALPPSPRRCSRK